MGDISKGMISIVVPVYNAEQYLSEALDCLERQSYENYEVILVDDGSTDDSGEICKSISSVNPRFRYIHQDNAGAGAARNRGIVEANGEFLMFLDADDLFDAELLSRLHGAIERDGSDVCICRADSFRGRYNSSATIKYATYAEAGSASPEAIADHFFQSVTCSPWDKLFRTSHIIGNDLRFQTLRYSNDNYFVLMSLLLAGSISWIEDILVHYRLGDGGSLRDKMYRAPLCDLEMLDSLRASVSKSPMAEVPGLIGSLDLYTVDLVIYSYSILATQSKDACTEFWLHLVGESIPKWESLKGGPLEIRGLKRKLKFNAVKDYGPERMVWASSVLGDNGFRTAGPWQHRMANLRLVISPLFVSATQQPINR